MIVFVVARGYARTHKHVSEAARGRTDIRVRSYQELCTLGSADKATYVFTDMDRLAGPNLLAAGLLYRRLKAADIRVLNDPARIPSRSGLLRRLAKRGRRQSAEPYRERGGCAGVARRHSAGPAKARR